MNVSFSNNYLVNGCRKLSPMETKRHYEQTQNCLVGGLCAGVLSGTIATSVMSYKKLPNKFLTSFSIASGAALFTYMGCLLYTTIQNMKNIGKKDNINSI